MRYLLLITISLLMFSCKAPKSIIIESELKEETNIQKDVSLTDSTKVSIWTEEILKRLLNEKLNIIINQKKYDTSQPINPDTGLPPLLEENDIDISKETDVQEEAESNQKAESSEGSELKDNSSENIKIDKEVKETEKERISSIQRFLIIIGLMVVGVGLFFLIRFIYKKFK